MTKIIDCTLRDGGHLNRWNFDINFAKELYITAKKSGVDYFEAGYRNLKKDSSFGDFYSCNDDFLFSVFENISECRLSVMADVGKTDLKLFRKCIPENTPVSLVRIASYPDRLNEAFELCEGIKNLGYDVILNLMAIAKFSGKDFEKISEWENKSVLTSVCFSDSFGSFLPNDVMKYHNILKQAGFINISFHAHNNLQLAFANSIIAADNNFFSVDGSACGLGRSAGITPTELILWYLQKLRKDKYNPFPYIEFIFGNKEKFNSFSVENSVKAIIGGMKNLHPNYINELFESNGNSVKDILEMADIILKKGLISK